ncbi:MAG: class I SAM-dependent methyltransferase [Candidatus Omnitrophota bacterium]
MAKYPVYSAFAEIYDQVMRDVDYEGWSRHLIDLANRYGVKVNKILDLACGSGSMLLCLLKNGYEASGLDLSETMLRLASEKFKKAGFAVPLYRTSMESFSRLKLPRNFDLIACLYDSLNYILDENGLISCFTDVYKHLRPGGVFIFDVTTEYNLLHNFAGYTFAENFDKASYIWENEYDVIKKICNSKVTVFYEEDGQYKKQIEMHTQRVYPTSDLLEMLHNEGFDTLGAFHNMTQKPVEEKCERIHFVCRKPE